MPAKVLMIRGMLRRGFLFSSQLYAMGTHDLGQVESVLDALDETLGEVDRVRAEGRLRDVAGAGEAKAGFARLA